MEILCLGLSHHTAPVDLREKFAIAESEAPAVAAQLLSRAGRERGGRRFDVQSRGILCRGGAGGAGLWRGE